jgi:hypothetical protein
VGYFIVGRRPQARRRPVVRWTSTIFARLSGQSTSRRRDLSSSEGRGRYDRGYSGCAPLSSRRRSEQLCVGRRSVSWSSQRAYRRIACTSDVRSADDRDERTCWPDVDDDHHEDSRELSPSPSFPSARHNISLSVRWTVFDPSRLGGGGLGSESDGSWTENERSVGCSGGNGATDGLESGRRARV